MPYRLPFALAAVRNCGTLPQQFRLPSMLPQVSEFDVIVDADDLDEIKVYFVNLSSGGTGGNHICSKNRVAG